MYVRPKHKDAQIAVLQEICLNQLMIKPSIAVASFIQSTRMQRNFEKNLNSVMLVFIGKLSLSSLR